jgi:glycosyltransferase involved in cell wall biosynthesis
MREYGNQTPLGKAASFGKGIFSIFEQQGYYEVSGGKQVRFLDECLERRPSAVFAHRLSAMCPVLLTDKELPPVFFDFDDIEHIVLSRYIAQQAKTRSKLLRLLLPALIAGEKKSVRLSAETYICSDKDRILLESEFGARNVAVIPNSVSVPDYSPPSTDQVLLFLSSDYGANLAAAKYLVHEIWPRVLKKLPQAKLIIAGTAADKLGFNVAGIQGLEVPGFVDDLDKLYENIRATVAPILIAGGTRFKIIEAAAFGRPTVSTTVGAEGTEFVNGSEILIRDNPEDFADACVNLLVDIERASSIGIAAREKAIRLYDRQNVIVNIRQHINRQLRLNQNCYPTHP